MPSSKGTSNTNKTAHVMNLLRKNTPAPHQKAEEAPAPAVSEPDQPSASARQAPQKPEPQPAAPAPQPASAPPIIAALNADSEISLQIRDALSEELEKEDAPQAPAQPSPTPVREQEPSVPAQEPPAPAQEPEDRELPAKKEEPPEPPQEQSAPAEAEISAPLPVHQEPPAPLTAQPLSEPAPQPAAGPEIINVIHRILEAKADKYIRMFGVCTCPKCRMDVIALALNQLPAKYVVMEPQEILLRSDMYEVRYNCEVSAQLMRACKQVKEHPRH